MQASTFSVKGNLGFHVQNRGVLPGFGDLKKRSSVLNNLRRTQGDSCFGLRLTSVSMRAELGRSRTSVESFFSITGKGHISPKAQATEGELEDVAPTKIQGKSSASVLPYVGVACLGAILFGYHLGVVNGALEYLSKDLGIAENTVLQGWVVSTLLAGATVCSFTGGAFADKFGRTKTFLLDANPLTIGAFLWFLWTRKDIMAEMVRNYQRWTNLLLLASRIYRISNRTSTRGNPQSLGLRRGGSAAK